MVGGGVVPGTGNSQSRDLSEREGTARSSPIRTQGKSETSPSNHHAICSRERGSACYTHRWDLQRLQVIKEWPRDFPESESCYPKQEPPENHLGAGTAMTTRGCHAPIHTSKKAQPWEGCLSSIKPKYETHPQIYHLGTG